MADAFKFELVSPEKLLVSEQVEAVVIPGSEGEMTVMANHAPLIAMIKPGLVSVKPAAGAERRYVVYGGLADIQPQACILLAEAAVALTDLDRDDLSRRIRQAQEALAGAGDDSARSQAEVLLAQLSSLENALAA